MIAYCERENTVFSKRNSLSCMWQHRIIVYLCSSYTRSLAELYVSYSWERRTFIEPSLSHRIHCPAIRKQDREN